MTNRFAEITADIERHIERDPEHWEEIKDTVEEIMRILKARGFLEGNF
jgi:hypothetical protein